MRKVYRRVDLGSRETYLTALDHLYNLLTRPGNECDHIVLHQGLSKKYLVVDMQAWHNQNRRTSISAEQAMHQAAETFDTLEQAMLYYHAVS